MPIEMTLRVEFSRDGLLELRQRVEELLGQLETGAAGAFDASPVEQARARIQLLRDRAGEQSWKFLATVARSFPGEREFALDDVAEAMKVDVGAVKAYHRNIARSDKQVSAAMDRPAPPLLASRQVEGRNVYRLPADVRDAIIALAEPADA